MFRTTLAALTLTLVVFVNGASVVRQKFRPIRIRSLTAAALCQVLGRYGRAACEYCSFSLTHYTSANGVQAAMGLVRGLAGSGYHITVIIPYFDQPNNQ